MTDFENWFRAQDFYLNMRQIYGNQLFSRDGDRYRSMHVHIAYMAYQKNWLDIWGLI